MRSVNLIPPDERRGDSAPLRTGTLIYVLVAGLALLLLGIVAVALTGKQVNDREAKKANLQQELTQATTQAQNVAAFTSFRTVQANRAATVSSLAQSRFDWSRVMHELSLVLPNDITLSTLTGTASPEVQLQDAEQVDLRTNVAGPALEITGCAPTQDAVAGFVAALQDIDGATRVGLASSKRDDPSTSAGTSSTGSASSSSSSQCQVGPGIIPYQFQIVVAFDSVPTPSTATATPSVPPPATAPSGSGQSQVADAETQNQENIVKASVREKTVKGQNAVKDLIPGG